MRRPTGLTFVRKSVVTVAVLGCWLLTCPIAAAQGPSVQGQDAVYPASCTCCAASPSFIDASMFLSGPPTNNLCSVLNYVLVNVVQPKYPAGAVIDARGLNSSNTSMTCTANNPSPRLAHLYVLEAVTKLKIVSFESQDVVLRVRLDHNL